ncbi:hypothetical protein D3C84_813610 [compost metagenome]
MRVTGLTIGDHHVLAADRHRARMQAAMHMPQHPALFADQLRLFGRQAMHHHQATGQRPAPFQAAQGFTEDARPRHPEVGARRVLRIGRQARLARGHQVVSNGQTFSGQTARKCNQQHSISPCRA